MPCPARMSDRRRTDTCVRHSAADAMRTVSAAARTHPKQRAPYRTHHAGGHSAHPADLTQALRMRPMGCAITHMAAPVCDAMCHALATNWAWRSFMWNVGGEWRRLPRRLWSGVPATVKQIMGYDARGSTDVVWPLARGGVGVPHPLTAAEMAVGRSSGHRVGLSPRAPGGGGMPSHARSSHGCWPGSSACGGATRGHDMQSARNATDGIGRAITRSGYRRTIALCGVDE